MLYEELIAAPRRAAPERFNFAWDVVDAWAEDRGRLAIYGPPGQKAPVRLAFGDVREASLRTASAFLALGVDRGDRMVVALPAVPAWAVAVVAALRAGIVVVPGDPRGDRIDSLVRKTEASAILRASSRELVVENLRTGAVESLRNAASRSRPISRLETSRDEPAFWFPTPAGRAVHAHGMAFDQALVGRYWLNLRPGDLAWTLPETAASRIAFALLAPWSLGVPILLAGDTPARPAIRRLLEESPVTVLCAPVSVFRRLLARPPARHGIRHAAAMGVPSPDVVEGWKRHGIVLHHGFGNDEWPLAIGQIEGVPVKPGSIGRPFPGRDVHLVDERGREVADEEHGELAFRVGAELRRTGTRAWRDPQGHFWLV